MGYGRINRNYQRPFFRQRGRGKRRWLLLIYVLALTGFLGIVYVQFDRLQLAALDAVGFAPTPTPFASDWATRGAEAYAAGDLEAAGEAYGRAVQQQPTNVLYLYEYGRILIELGSVSEAVQLGEQAVAANPRDVRGYALRAKAMVRSGDSAGAIPVAQTGLEINPNFSPIYAALSEAYLNIQRYQQALRFGQQAIEIDPLDADSHRSYAYSLIVVGDRRTAIEHFEIAISINPNLTAPYFELAFQYKTLNLNEMAVATYLRILDLEPDNERAYLRLCETYAGVGQFAQAQAYCERAIEINPTYGEAYRELGRMRYNRRNYEGAIESFEQCVSFGAQDIECWYLRGLAMYFLNRCDEAWGVLEESLVRVQELVGGEGVEENIRIGLYNITQRCTGYAGRALPTEIPPTPIPPTPIGS